MAYRPKNLKERIIHRLQIAQGHVKKVQQMVEDDVYCIEIIHQSQAVQQALKEVDNILLENHLQSCTADAIRAGKQNEAVAEVMNVFRKSN